MKDWISQKVDYNKNNDLLLQIDIEGDEYSVINALDEETIKKFRIILIEFHQLHYLFDDYMFEKINDAFKKILKFFYCSHIHPNNDVDFIFKEQNIIIPPVLEFSFLRKDRGKILDNELSFPSKIDQPNNSKKRDIILPKCWYKPVN